MNEFAISGYSGNPCLMCIIDGGDIWQADYFGNRQQLIGKTCAAYTELESTTQQYYDKLVELGVITPAKTQEQLMGEMQTAMADMSNIIKSLTAQIKEMKENGNGADPGIHREDVSRSQSAGRGAASEKGNQRNG